MATELKTTKIKRKQDLKGGFGLHRCSGHECSQIFDEKSEAYWKHAPRRMTCKACGGEVIVQRNHFAANSNQMIYICWCDFCKEEFALRTPLSRKYCSVCKLDWYTSWTFDLRAPLSAHEPSDSCIAVNPKSSAA